MLFKMEGKDGTYFSKISSGFHGEVILSFHIHNWAVIKLAVISRFSNEEIRTNLYRFYECSPRQG